MLIVISNPTPVPNETTIINGLFDAGMEIFHLRKPEYNLREIKMLLKEIHTQYHHQIALHQHHEIANEYGIKRWHLTEAKRKEMSEQALRRLREDNNILSTSIHNIEAYNTLSSAFDYTFFGPVFNSISKEGYASSLKNDFVFPVKKNYPKVIAIGGIDAINIQQVMDMQFNGVVVLGTIWQNPEESIQQFKAVQKAWKQADQ